MKKKLAMLFVVIMILSCMPVMAGTVPADASAATNTVSVSATTTGWQKSGSNWRYYVNGSYVKSKLFKIGKAYYSFDSKGYMQKDWVSHNGKKYFASWIEGAKGFGKILSGYRKIGDYYYYLDPYKQGEMQTGLVKVGTKYYYFDTSTGRQVRKAGTYVIAIGRKYQVQADGHLKLIGKAPTDPYGMNKKAQGYTSQTKYLILVNKSQYKVAIYKGSKGKWTLTRGPIDCTIGKSSTPTKSGDFNISTMRKGNPYGYKDFSGSTAFYATRLNAGFYFHSILYKKGSRNPATAKVKDGRLRKSISNSCIRLPLADAKYIYELPFRSAVIIY